MEIKVGLHIPTEQYGFVLVECEGLSAEQTAELYNEYSRAFLPKVGLADKEYNAFIDRMLMGQDGNHIEQYEAMNDNQKYAVQVLKRGIKRLKAKE